MSFRKCARTRRLTNSCPLEIQLLENRRLLAADITGKDPDNQLVIMPYAAPVDGGTVAVSVSSVGDITLIGDAKPNIVNVEIRGNAVVIDGAESTSFRLPGAVAQPSLEVPLPATVRSIHINLAGGADSLYVKVSSDATIARDVVVNLGSGDDSLILQVVNADLKINQNLTVELGAGNDFADIFVAEAGSLTANRDINVRAGSGDDTVVTGDDDYVDLDLLYNVEYFMGLENNSEIPLAQRIRAGRDFTVDLGAGNDRLSLLNAESGRNLSVAAAGGVDTLVASNLRSARNTSITDAEGVALQNLTAVGNLFIRGGSGSGRASLDRVAVNRLDINLGFGNDQLVLGEAVTVNVASSVNGGTGNNSAYSAKPQPKITFRRTTQTLTPVQSTELLISVLDQVAGNLRAPAGSSGITPFQSILAE